MVFDTEGYIWKRRIALYETIYTYTALSRMHSHAMCLGAWSSQGCVITF